MSKLSVSLKGEIGDFTLNAEFETEASVTALFGPSGAGKSLILRGIAGLWQPKSGLVKLNENELLNTSQKVCVPTHLRGLGVVLQQPLLFPNMTVRQNLRYGMKENSVSFNDLVQLLDIGDLTNRMPTNLSGGEAQRIALGRALLADPKMLLLDEPLTGLDEARREQVLPYLKKLPEFTDVPILYVSHDREEILSLAEVVLPVQNGTIGPACDLEKFRHQTNA